MAGNRRWIFALLVASLMLAVAAAAAAQGASDGTLVFGQPLPKQIVAGQILNYDYALAQPSAVTFQALGDTTQPTITVLRDGEIVAQETNAGGALTIGLNALLDAGDYVVQVAAANSAAGLIVVFVQNEAPITTTTLALASPVSGTVNTSAPLALYTFTALAEPALLYIESSDPTGGVNVHVVNTTTGVDDALIAPSVLGARLRIPAGSDAYQVEVRSGDSGSGAFMICLAGVSTGGCEAGAATQVPAVVETPDYVPCTVTPSTGNGANVRQSASEAARVDAQLPAGSSADVIGISPDGQYYNVLYRGYNGWIAFSTVTSNGSCGTDFILVINPPPVVQDQAALVAPTAVPPVQPTQPPPPPQPSGACVLTVVGDQLIYTTTNAIADYIYDQVHPGYELIPIARLADNTWWQVNYANSWVQTSTFGTTIQVSGNCAGLPVVSP